MGRAEGLSTAKLVACVAPLAEIDESGLFTAIELVAFEYAEAMTTGDVSDALFAQVQQRFDEDTIVELTAAIAWENSSARFNRALRVPSQSLWAESSD